MLSNSSKFRSGFSKLEIAEGPVTKRSHESHPFCLSAAVRISQSGRPLALEFGSSGLSHRSRLGLSTVPKQTFKLHWHIGGDFAHIIPPDLGQGACCALEDGSLFFAFYPLRIHHRRVGAGWPSQVERT